MGNTDIVLYSHLKKQIVFKYALLLVLKLRYNYKYKYVIIQKNGGENEINNKICFATGHFFIF